MIGRPGHNQRIHFKDGNSLNCSKSNLEYVTRSQKGHQTYHKSPSSKSNFRGVIKGYRATIKIDGKVKLIGSYETEIEAAKAYNKKAIEIYGDLAILNDVGQPA
jgi:hypothetical protein